MRDEDPHGDPTVDTRDEVSGIGVSSPDITERSPVDATLYEANERFRHAFENAPIGIALVAPDGRWLRVNPALCEIVGYTPDELAGMTFQDITHPEDLLADLDQVRRVLAGDIDRYSMEKRYFHRDGHEVWIELSVSLARDRDGAPMYFVSQIQDISNRKRYEGELQHLADHDVLTGLFNRRRFDLELHRAVSRAQRYRESGALLVIDIDNFKFINDDYGHAAGDDLIARAAIAIRDRLRETDIAARLGGDEFAVILSGAKPEHARSVASNLVRELPALTESARHGPQMTASVGIAMIAPETQLSAEDLLIEADLAMYDAKGAGRDRITVATFVDDAPQRVKGRIAWVQRIHDALDTHGLVLYEQPLLDLRSGTITRHELLLRMKGENGDLIPPSAFLGTAERSSLIGAIDRWVIAEATRILTERHDAGENLTLEVNISGVSVSDPKVLEHVMAELRDARFDPSQLVLEITETAAILNVAQARRFAEKLRRLGCQLALDDFGSGFSSFQYLKHLPFDTVKIDGGFIKNVASSRVDQVAVAAIVQMAHGLGKTVVAEHVEGPETLNYLRAQGVDYVQGYYIRKPAPAHERWGVSPLAERRA